jgi:hypothetical protein
MEWLRLDLLVALHHQEKCSNAVNAINVAKEVFEKK